MTMIQDTSQELHLPQVESLDAVRQEIHSRQQERIYDQKEMLVSSPELRQIIGEVAEVRGRSADTQYTDFKGLRTAMRSVFDFRTDEDGKYGERWEVEERAKQFLESSSQDLKDRIYASAENFGLTGDTEPSEPKVKLALVLGGGGKAPLDRTMYAKELMDAGKLDAEYLVSLGSERPIDGDKERQRAGEYSQNCKTEFDLLVSAAEHTFGTKVTESDIIEWTDPSIMGGVPNKSRIAHIASDGTRPEVFIISSAIVTEPFMEVDSEDKMKTILRNRANSEDTFALTQRVAGLQPGDKLVAVTNAHFKPFQGAAASAQLGEFGVDTEVVGFDPTHFGNPAKRSDELLQEMLTTADSLSKAK